MVKLSIIVPVYNVEAYLDKCLKSLVNQLLDNIEVIVINDGSPDHSQKIIDRYIKKYPKIIKSKTIPNGGVGNARNVGLSMASGEYVAFLDSDDYVHKDTYIKLYDRAKETNADMVACGYYNVHNDVLTEKHVDDGELFGNNIKNHPELIRESLPFCWAYIYRKKMLDKYDLCFTKHKIFEDLLFVYKCYKHANKIEKVYEPLVYYVDRTDGTSVTQKFSLKFFDIFEVMRELKKYYGNTIDKKYLTFIALRHIYIRFNTKIKFSEMKIKKQFIEDSYNFLDEFDSEWKSNIYFEKIKKVIILLSGIG